MPDPTTGEENPPGPGGPSAGDTESGAPSPGGPDSNGQTAVNGPAPSSGRHLVVARYQSATMPGHGVSLTDDQAEGILEDMGHVLQTDHDGGGTLDHAVDISFELDGPVAVFDDPKDGYIYTPQDFERIMAKQGCVKVVKGISHCGTKTGTFWGCGEVGGTRFAVIRDIAAKLEGNLWAHEYGHNQGLPHRDAFGAIMREKIDGNSTRVDEDERLAYETAPSETGCAARTDTTVQGTGSQGGGEEPK